MVIKIENQRKSHKQIKKKKLTEEIKKEIAD